MGNRLLSKVHKRLRKAIWRLQARARGDFLKNCRGIIHVGANSCQERDAYKRHDLPVVWIEAAPEPYQALVANLEGYSKQRAISALVLDTDGTRCTFHVANNAGASSSVLDMALHKDIWPHVDYSHDIELVSQTLPSALAGAGIDVANYDALVMDTQGSELSVLRGASDLLKGFRYIKTEAADFESYKGCARVESLADFLRDFGFVIDHKAPFATHPSGGTYFDVLFRREPT